MFALNSTPLKGLGDLSPRQVMMGMDEKDPIEAVLFHPTAKAPVVGIDLTAGEYRTRFVELQRTIGKMHEHVDEKKNAKAQKELARIAKDKKNKVRNYSPKMANFEPGQFVLKARLSVNNKLKARWEGPYKVLRAVNEYVYVIQDLLDENKEFIVHCRRLCFYADASLNVDIHLKDTIGHARGNVDFEALEQLRFNPQTQQFEFFIKWLGFDEVENTWEEVAGVYQDAPRMVTMFLTANKKHEQFKKVVEMLIMLKPSALTRAAALIEPSTDAE
jgi:mRNA-degrading endonuclease RelE of RelBE toxin-antitoxin system